MKVETNTYFANDWENSGNHIPEIRAGRDLPAEIRCALEATFSARGEWPEANFVSVVTEVRRAVVEACLSEVKSWRGV